MLTMATWQRGHVAMALADKFNKGLVDGARPPYDVRPVAVQASDCKFPTVFVENGDYDVQPRGRQGWRHNRGCPRKLKSLQPDKDPRIFCRRYGSLEPLVGLQCGGASLCLSQSLAASAPVPGACACAQRTPASAPVPGACPREHQPQRLSLEPVPVPRGHQPQRLSLEPVPVPEPASAPVLSLEPGSGAEQILGAVVPEDPRAFPTDHVQHFCTRSCPSCALGLDREKIGEEIRCLLQGSADCLSPSFPLQKRRLRRPRWCST